jgi:hypothetical protein
VSEPPGAPAELVRARAGALELTSGSTATLHAVGDVTVSDYAFT